MTKTRVLLGVALAATLFAGAAGAADLKPAEARSIAIGNVSALAYYTVEPDGYHVVATLAQHGSESPVRIKAVLATGQSVVFSTPRAPGEPENAVEISREHDQALVRTTAVGE